MDPIDQFVMRMMARVADAAGPWARRQCLLSFYLGCCDALTLGAEGRLEFDRPEVYEVVADYAWAWTQLPQLDRESQGRDFERVDRTLREVFATVAEAAARREARDPGAILDAAVRRARTRAACTGGLGCDSWEFEVISAVHTTIFDWESAESTQAYLLARTGQLVTYNSVLSLRHRFVEHWYQECGEMFRADPYFFRP